MKIKFQADADLKAAIVPALLRHNTAIDFQTANEAGLEGLLDPEVLASAAREGRILVSHDHRTMPTHFAEFVTTRHSPGVFLIAQDLPIGIAAEELFLIWETSEAEEWIDTLQWLLL